MNLAILVTAAASFLVLLAAWKMFRLIRVRNRYYRAETALETWLIDRAHVGKYPFHPEAQKMIRKKSEALASYRRIQAKAPRIVRLVLTDDPERLAHQAEHMELNLR